MGSFKAIPVRDGKGDELTVYEFRDRRFLKEVRRLKLCTGEAVRQVDEDTFAIVGTGEQLARDPDRENPPFIE